MTKYRPAKHPDEPGEWTIWDGFAFEAASPIYPSKRIAQEAADRANDESARWYRQPMCDAPHLDNYWED